MLFGCVKYRISIVCEFGMCKILHLNHVGSDV